MSAEIDYNQIYQPGDINNGTINIVVEVPFGSTDKIEWNRQTKMMEVDRVEPSAYPEPVNYGFIPGTTGGDGDNLDVCLVSDKPITSGTLMTAKIVGIMNFIDEGEIDDKIIAVSVDSKLNSISDIPTETLNTISNYFNHYKDYIRPGVSSFIDWGDINHAKETIHNAVDNWNNQ